MSTRPTLEFSPLDEQFALLLERLGGSADVCSWGKQVSAARNAGHTCWPLSAEEASSLRGSALVGEPGAFEPLVLDAKGRLYLQRYWQYEQVLAAALRARLAAPPFAVEEFDLSSVLPDAVTMADQRRAVTAAVRFPFCVITGGPGTGKTRTVLVILKLLGQANVALAAPTGKAAARLGESLADGQVAVTLHRLLGLSAHSATPRFDAAHPLPFDVVVVDEASMIDLALMAKLFAAVKPTARLILLGDRDQLASVEAGHVLGDIAEAARSVALTHNFRFCAESGLLAFSQAVNRGAAEEALALLGTSGVRLPEPANLAGRLREPVLAAYRDVAAAADATEALQALARFRILAAVRGGPYGVVALNRLAENLLVTSGAVRPGGGHYRGQPLLILENERHLGLSNGDLGVMWPDADGELRAHFPGSRSFPPARLPRHETVWAMTVHKSQGSEFQRVLLVLPDRDTPLLTRELIYTAVTRARDSVEVWHRPAILRAAIERRTERYSGLGDLLKA